MLEQHFDKYVAAYEERFEPRSGPLRHVVPEAVVQFLACGRLQGGFARLRCPACKSERLVAVSCRTRNFAAVVRPNAPRYLLKSSPRTFCLRSRTATGPLPFPKPSAACLSESDASWDYFPARWSRYSPRSSKGSSRF